MQLNLDTLWLRETGGGRAVFFPDVRNERFDFCSDVGYLITRLAVEGSSTGNSSGRALSSLAPSNIIPVNKKNSNGTTMNLRVYQGKIIKKSNGRSELERIGQTFITINESTANVPYLTHHVKLKWGHSYVLVTNDGIRIEDSSGTQGELMKDLHRVWPNVLAEFWAGKS